MYASIYILCTYMWLGGLWCHHRGVFAFGMMFVGCDIFCWLCLWGWLGFFFENC